MASFIKCAEFLIHIVFRICIDIQSPLVFIMHIHMLLLISRSSVASYVNVGTHCHAQALEIIILYAKCVQPSQNLKYLSTYHAIQVNALDAFSSTVNPKNQSRDHSVVIKYGCKARPEQQYDRECVFTSDKNDDLFLSTMSAYIDLHVKILEIMGWETDGKM